MESPNLSPTQSLAEGRAVIKRYVEEMPGAPGVYRMLDMQGNALYIGKAKNLRNRVSNYLQVEAMNNRLQRMVMQTASMEIITTRSEAEALLLEANLIKKMMPRYNILLRDDKSFPYIFFSGDHEYPRLSKHRGPKTKKGKYYGPFVSGHAVNETITLLQKVFLIRPCTDNIFKNRTRPCLQYQIKRCSAPCVHKISPEQYGGLVAQAQAFLSGKSRAIQDELVAEMQALSLKMDYEKARVVRDRIRALVQMQHQHSMETNAVGDADIIALARDAGVACIQLFSFRGGRNYGNKSWFFTQSKPFSDGEIIGNFIGQFYQAQPAPALIITSHLLEESALLEEALRLNSEFRIDIVHPLRGEKRELLEQAIRNAREGLLRHMAMHATQNDVLEGVQKLFGLDELPSRIEVYDNSHIMGTHAVGGMIVAGPEGYVKNEYRKFNIKSPAPSPARGEGWGGGASNVTSLRESPLPPPPPERGRGLRPVTPGDDYGMLREVLMRRFLRLQEEDADVAGKKPDLVLIDGGIGQLSVATGVFEELGIADIPYCGIAKGVDRNAGREWFHLPGREPFQLPPDDKVLHYLQRLRDEAHRFAIGAHRNKRSKALSTSSLDEIPSIGASRKKALLHHFGSARAVAAASMEDMQKVEGINTSTAKVIYEYFHGGE